MFFQSLHHLLHHHHKFYAPFIFLRLLFHWILSQLRISMSFCVQRTHITIIVFNDACKNLPHLFHVGLICMHMCVCGMRTPHNFDYICHVLLHLYVASNSSILFHSISCNFRMHFDLNSVENCIHMFIWLWKKVKPKMNFLHSYYLADKKCHIDRWTYKSHSMHFTCGILNLSTFLKKIVALDLFMKAIKVFLICIKM